MKQLYRIFTILFLLNLSNSVFANRVTFQVINKLPTNCELSFNVRGKYEVTLESGYDEHKIRTFMSLSCAIKAQVAPTTCSFIYIHDEIDKEIFIRNQEQPKIIITDMLSAIAIYTAPGAFHYRKLSNLSDSILQKLINAGENTFTIDQVPGNEDYPETITFSHQGEVLYTLLPESHMQAFENLRLTI